MRHPRDIPAEERALLIDELIGHWHYFRLRAEIFCGAFIALVLLHGPLRPMGLVTAAPLTAALTRPVGFGAAVYTVLAVATWAVRWWLKVSGPDSEPGR